MSLLLALFSQPLSLSSSLSITSLTDLLNAFESILLQILAVTNSKICVFPAQSLEELIIFSCSSNSLIIWSSHFTPISREVRCPEESWRQIMCNYWLVSGKQGIAAPRVQEILFLESQPSVEGLPWLAESSCNLFQPATRGWFIPWSSRMDFIGM